MNRTILHVVAENSRLRAEVARIVFAVGHHAEVYSDLDELLDRGPNKGIVIAVNEAEHATAHDLLRRLAEGGLWLPVVMASPDPAIEQVVAAIRGGALDFLSLPLERDTFARRLTGILAEAGETAKRRRCQVEAQHTIGKLSARERQVLELLSAGCSNKDIAGNLAISPRTVEIHRGNMMSKLRAGHAADAVRMWIDAQAGFTAPPREENSGSISGNSRGLGKRDACEPTDSFRRSA